MGSGNRRDLGLIYRQGPVANLGICYMGSTVLHGWAEPYLRRIWRIRIYRAYFPYYRRINRIYPVLLHGWTPASCYRGGCLD